MKNDSDRTEEEKKPQTERGKRSYSRPVLVSHGNLRDITLSVGSKGSKDSGVGESGRPNKTSS